MKSLPSFVALAIALGTPIGAGAASLTLESDEATYVVGETIVLTVTGLSEGAVADGLFAQLDYEGALTEGVSGSQIVHTTMNGAMSWFGGGDIGIQGDGTAFVLNQVAPTAPNGPSSTDPAPTIGTATLIAEAVGTVHVSYFVQAGDILTLSYFGITSLPGITFLIVPEPVTGALLALGLAAFAAGRRRRG